MRSVAQPSGRRISVGEPVETRNRHRPEPQRRSIARNRAVEIVLFQQGRGEIGVQLGELGIECDAAPEMFGGLRHASHGLQRIAEIVVEGGVRSVCGGASLQHRGSLLQEIDRLGGVSALMEQCSEQLEPVEVIRLVAENLPVDRLGRIEIARLVVGKGRLQWAHGHGEASFRLSCFDNST
jgi:hypothetical protein